MNIIPPPAGLRIVTAWNEKGRGWFLGDSLPVLAMAIEGDSLNPLIVAPGRATAELQSGECLGTCWKDALVEVDGRVVTAFGLTYESADSWLSALNKSAPRRKHIKLVA